jgi:hypothetical protein
MQLLRTFGNAAFVEAGANDGVSQTIRSFWHELRVADRAGT